MGFKTNQIARDSLGLLADSFRLFPLPDVPRPAAEEYGKFLIEHPQYAANYRIQAEIFAESRAASTVMPQHMQELAGALIRVTFSDEQLEQMGNN